MNEEAEAFLRETASAAAEILGPRLLACYALGSLAHGGFSPIVSDIDVGLILRDPLTDDDAARIQALTGRMKGSSAPLADRLSIFWGSIASLRGEVAGGRFPPLDRLDLLRHGRLLAGAEVRSRLPAPDRRELVVAAAEFALRVLARPDVVTQITRPADLVAQGVHDLTKRILFPVRFLYTARTGEIGRNDAAVAHYITRGEGPAAVLAAEALAWRDRPPPLDQDTVAIVSAGIRALYVEFLDDHISRMRDYGELDLAGRLAEWRERIASTSE
jgi:predicted nucleotidyltransferase